MDMHQIQQFTPFTADHWATLKAAVDDKLAVASDTGTASRGGITIRWAYDAQKELLEIQLMDRKWFDPSEATIDQKIHEMAEAIMLGK